MMRHKIRSTHTYNQRQSFYFILNYMYHRRCDYNTQGKVRLTLYAHRAKTSPVLEQLPCTITCTLTVLASCLRTILQTLTYLNLFIYSPIIKKAYTVH
jgi:hypothetical protein